MQIKTCLTLAASAGIASAAVHRHGHRHAHEQKRDIVFIETDIVTEVDWVTVTVEESATSSASVASTSSTTSTTSTTSIPTVPVAAPTTSTQAPAPPPTTLATSVSAAPVVAFHKSSSAAAAAAPTTTAAPSPVTTAAPAPVPIASSVAAPAPAPAPTTAAAAPAPVSGGNKRGAAYNTASLISPLLGSGSKLSWAYNWGQTPDGLSDGLEYVAMLWGDKQGMASSWAKNAQAAINSGTKNLLSINEPDNAGQANMSPAQAASFHIANMNPFSGKARISSPAITNSGSAGEGTDWLKQWVSACNGQCAFDFCAAHWYSPVSTSYFLSFLQDVHAACQNKPVWITEFAPSGSDADISSFLTEVQDQMDNNATYSFVERYSYFMVNDGSLLSGTAASSIGHTFAFA